MFPRAAEPLCTYCGQPPLIAIDFIKTWSVRNHSVVDRRRSVPG